MNRIWKRLARFLSPLSSSGSKTRPMMVYSKNSKKSNMKPVSAKPRNKLTISKLFLPKRRKLKSESENFGY